MNALESTTRKTQKFWGVDAATAEEMTLFVVMRQLVHNDTALLWEETHTAYPTLHQPKTIRCAGCGAVVVFSPNDGTLSVRDDGELVCLDCRTPG